VTADPLESQTGLTASQRRMRARIAANKRWANTIDRTAATAPARDAREQAFLDQVDPDGTLLPGERQKRAENARTAFYQQMAYKSVQSRRAVPRRLP
jgi:hypothetical protein